MTREDIIRMAREAGFPDYAMGLASEDAWQKTERFAALVAEAEREAICPIVYGLCVSDNNAQEIVNAIRARGSNGKTA
jgi:hypothetical protein